MAVTNKDKIEVTTEFLIRVALRLKRASDPMCEQIEQMLLDHDRVHSGPKEVKEGDIVEPKTGWNVLRAGDTAHGKAIVLSMNPSVLCSLEGAFDWRGYSLENFIPVGRVNETVLAQLKQKWGI